MNNKEIKMRILFCNIAWMKEYRGITEEDTAVNGGSYVNETNDANEAYNFDRVIFDDDKDKIPYCLGFLKQNLLMEGKKINYI